LTTLYRLAADARSLASLRTSLSAQLDSASADQ